MRLWAGILAAALLCAQDLEEHARAAQAAQARGDFETAIREYQALARAAPDHPEILANLGIVYYLHREPEKAIETFGKALARNPKLFPAWLFSGLASYQLGRPDRAAENLARAAALNPADPVAHHWLGLAYTAQERPGLAYEEYRTASRLQPGDIDVWYALGQTCLELGKRETRKLLAGSPDGARAWQLAGEQWKLRGDEKKASALFEGASARSSDAAQDGLYQAAHQYESEAHQAFERVMQLGPDSYRAHQILAESLSLQGRSQEAIAEYQEVLRRKDDLPGVHQALGVALLQQAQVPEALREFEAESRLQPYAAGPLVLQARALLAQGDEVRAEAVLGRALKLNRPPAEINKLLGKIQLRHQDYAGAARSLEGYLSGKKEDANAHYLLMQAYRGAGNAEGVRRESALFRQYSLDARKRSRAQTSFDYFQRPAPEEETPEDAAGSQVN